METTLGQAGRHRQTDRQTDRQKKIKHTSKNKSKNAKQNKRPLVSQRSTTTPNVNTLLAVATTRG